MAIRVRRSSPPRHKSYQRYKPHLREDFAYGCVYCSLHENEAGGPRFFTVEHFRPKSRFPQLAVEYDNLLYACGVCNSYKSNDWPSEPPRVDGPGYLNPCEHDYEAHFSVDAGFQLRGSSSAARYMIERLHLNRGMLLKLRRLRAEEEEVHGQFVELFARTMALLEEELAAADAAQARGLQRELDRLRRQYELRLAAWDRRRQPLYSMDDYR